MRTIIIVVVIAFVLSFFSTAYAAKKIEPEICGPENTQQSLVRYGTFLFADRDTDAVLSGVVYHIIPMQPDGYETIVIHSHPDSGEDPEANVAFAIFEWSCDRKGVRPEDDEQCEHFWQYHRNMDEDFRSTYVYAVKSHEIVPGVLKGKLHAIDARLVTRWVRESPKGNIYANRAFIRNQITGDYDLIHERRFFDRNHCVRDQDDPREGAHERIEFFTNSFPKFHAVGFMNMFMVKINGDRKRILFYSYNDGLYNFANFWGYPYAIRGTPADFLMFYNEKEKTSRDTRPGNGTWVGINKDRILSNQDKDTNPFDNPFSVLHSEDTDTEQELDGAPEDNLPSIYRWIEERQNHGVTELPEDIQEALESD